jgi:predicted regulator of Ras-like GTPase activity (Roadblock/LC7/MglB family)
VSVYKVRLFASKSVWVYLVRDSYLLSLNKVTVMLSQTVLYEEEQFRLKHVCSSLLKEALAKTVIVLDREGQMLANSGDTEGVDLTAMASLVAGMVAATSGLAQLMGEDEFPAQAHEGKESNLLLSCLGLNYILVVIYDKQSSLGLVRLRARKSSIELLNIFKCIEERSDKTDGVDLLSEISDADIENLIGDAF